MKKYVAKDVKKPLFIDSSNQMQKNEEKTQTIEHGLSQYRHPQSDSSLERANVPTGFGSDP